MYERFYGLTDRPFDLTPDPRFLFFTPKHREALSNLLHGIRQRKGVTMVIGAAGTGKTTLIRAAIAGCAERPGAVVTLVNPSMTRGEFLQAIARGFGLGDEAGRSKAALLPALEAFLLDRFAQQLATALIIDEAQALSDELLEEVRLLVNIETETAKLLPIVLVGQQELSERLTSPEHAALKQRIALRCELASLTAAETAQYIATRIRVAGGVPAQLFTREAVDMVHERSGGTPRVISVICDNALLSGYALGQRRVDRKLVLEVCRDFDLGGVPAPGDEAPLPPPLPAVAPSAAVPAPPAPPRIAVKAAAPAGVGALSPLLRMFGRPARP